jgi:protein TonB
MLGMLDQRLWQTGSLGRSPWGSTQAPRFTSIGVVIGVHLVLVAALTIQRHQPVAVAEAPLKIAMIDTPAAEPAPAPTPVTSAKPDLVRPPLPQLPLPSIVLDKAITLPATQGEVATMAETVSPDTSAAITPAANPHPTSKSAGPSPHYMSTLMAHLNRKKRYPAAARKLRQHGIVHVRFRMNRAGRLLMARLEAATRHSLLNEEALALLERAIPLPILPDDMPDSIELVVPIEFSLSALE